MTPADKQCPRTGGLPRHAVVLEVLRGLAAADGVVRVSKAEIARRTGLSSRTIHNTFDELLRAELLELLDLGGADKCNTYRVELLEDLEQRLEDKRRAAWEPHIAPLLEGHAECSAFALRRLYALLLARRWRDTSFAFPSVAYAARALELTERQVQRLFEVLDRVKLAERRELAAGELFPHGRRARGGELLRIVHVVPRPRRVTRGTAMASPPGRAMASVQEHERSATASGGTATASPEVLNHEDHRSGEKAIAREDDPARTVIARYCASALPGLSFSSDLVKQHSLEFVGAMQRRGWTADELVRVASKWVASCPWRNDPAAPLRRLPAVVFHERNVDKFAALRRDWRDVGAEMLRPPKDPAPRVVLSREEIEQRRAVTARFRRPDL